MRFDPPGDFVKRARADLTPYPVVIGRGHRLFTDATDVPGLHLEEVRPFSSGIVLLRYRSTPQKI